MGDENCISRDRASRSRSKTPFLRSSCDRELCSIAGGLLHSGNHHIHVQYQKSLTAVTKTQDEGKKHTFTLKYSDTILGTASVTGGVKSLKRGKGGSTESAFSQKKIENLRQINGVYRNSKVRDGASAVSKTVSSNLMDGRTSDYSSEEGENTHQEVHKAFQLYKETGDWWNVFPKTDYTYSKYSPHRREIAPGIVNMPNMSRLGLHCGSSKTTTTTTRHEFKQQSEKNVNSPNFERSKYVSAYPDSAGNLHVKKWARVFETENAATEVLREEQTFLNVTRTSIARTVAVILYFVSSIITWTYRNISPIWPDMYYPTEKNNVTSLTIRAILQWIYRVLAYTKIVDTWLLMGWSNFDVSSHGHVFDNRSHSTWSKLLKWFIILSPSLIVAGLWAYLQFWDDQGVSNSVYIPEPNKPLLTSHPKIDPGHEIQDFGTYSLLKFLAGSSASGLHVLWMWLLYPWNVYNQSNKVGVINSATYIPAPKIFSVDRIVAEECPQPKIDMDELATKIISNPVFASLLSATNTEPVHNQVKVQIDNILSEVNMLQQYRFNQIDMIKNVIKTEVADSLNGFAMALKESEQKIQNRIMIMENQNENQLSEIQKLSMDIDVIVSKTRLLESLIKEESTSRENSVFALRKDLISNPALHHNENCDFGESKLKGIVDAALLLYDADKTGRADYALESSGGSIVSTRCTETYHAKTAVVSLFGINLWYTSNNPRKIIQPGVHPGECWAFKGSQGYVVIKLSKRIYINMFSLEHIPKVLSPVGTIDSAPRHFSVWGLKDEMDTEGLLLGQYTYDQNGSSLQSFPVEKPDLPPYQFIELRIESNHGNLEYTCLYRFRVHGSVHRE